MYVKSFSLIRGIMVDNFPHKQSTKATEFHLYGDYSDVFNKFNAIAGPPPAIY